MKICVVGAGGYLGAMLAARLAVHPGVELVHAVYSERTVRFLSHPKVVPFVADAGDYRCSHALAGMDTVVHFGGRCHPLNVQEIDGRAEARESTSLRALLDDMAAWGVHRIVYASSGGAIYRSDGHRSRPFVEADEVEERSAYAKTKLACERVLNDAAAVGAVSGAILRIANPFGIPFARGRAKGFLSVALDSLLNDRPLEIWGTLSTRKDFIHIDDIGSAVEAVLTLRDRGVATFNVGSGMSHSLGDAVNLLASLTGSQPNLKFAPMRPGDAPWTALDVGALARATGWQPRIGLSEGLVRFVHHQRQVASFRDPILDKASEESSSTASVERGFS